MQVLSRILGDGSVGRAPGAGFGVCPPQADGLLVPLNPTLPVTPQAGVDPSLPLAGGALPGDQVTFAQPCDPVTALTEAVLKVYSLAQVHAVVPKAFFKQHRETFLGVH